MILTIKTIKERWKAETPIFWKSVRKLMIKIGTSSVAILSAEKLFNLLDYGVPEVVFTICGYILVVCAGVGLTSQLTIKDSENG